MTRFILFYHKKKRRTTALKKKLKDAVVMDTGVKVLNNKPSSKKFEEIYLKTKLKVGAVDKK
jgi:hypothetical protein